MVATDDSSTVALPSNEEESLVEPDIRDRFKRMCEGYFDSVSKKLVIEHKVGCTCTSVPSLLTRSSLSAFARAR